MTEIETHKHKLKDILSSPEIIYEKPIEERGIEPEEEKKGNSQQSLFDF